MKLRLLIILIVLTQELEAAMVMLNARPHAPLGFYMWFGGLAVLAPFIGFWLYRRLVRLHKH